MSWFRYWKQLKSEALAKKEEIVYEGEIVETPIRPNSQWVIKISQSKGDPFPIPNNKRYAPVTVLEVRDGWVRYYIGSMFPDERKDVDTFLKMYEPY